MAYGVIYRLRAETVKWKDDIIIDILKNGYSGEVNLKYIGAGGITLTKDGDGKINGTSLQFSMQSDSNFEYVNFFEADEREYMVKLYKNTVLIWQGFLISDEYNEEFKDPPYDVHLLANDGLGLLKNYDYPCETVSTNKIRRLDAILKIINLINFGIPMNVAYDVYISPASNNQKLFEYAYFSDDYFDGWTAYEVLEKLIPPDCTITQHQNKWLIRRNEQDSEKTHTSYTRIPDIPEFQGEIYYEAVTGAGETVLDLAPIGTGDVYPIGTAEMSMLHAWKEMTINADLVKRPSFLRNYNFEDGFDNWTTSATGFADTYNINGVYCLGLEGDAVTTGANVSQSISPWDNEDDFALELKFGLRASRRNVTNGNHYAIEGEVYFRVKIEGESLTYYLDKETGWTTGVKYISEKVTSNPQGIDWYDLKVYADSPPVSGMMTFEVFRFHTSLLNVSAILFTVTDVVMKTYAGDDYNDSIKYDIALRTNGTETSEDTLVPCDAPDVNNYDHIFYNGQADSLNARITGFDNLGVATGSTYTNIILNSLYWLHGIPRQIINGTFRGQNLHLNAVIQAASSADRKYTVKSGSWDILYDKFEMELLEIPGSATGSSWTIPDTDYGSVGTWETGGVKDKKRGTSSSTVTIPTQYPAVTSDTANSRKPFHGVALFGDLSFNDTTQVLTVASGLNTYWFAGEIFSTTGDAIACDLNDYYETPVENTIYYFKFIQSDGILTASESVWNLKTEVPVATAYYNGTGFAVAYECHSHMRDLDWHIWAHKTVGARYETGLLKTYPDTTHDAQLQIETGQVYDEDIQLIIAQTTGIRGWYQVSSGIYTWRDYDLPYLGASGDPYWLDTDDYTLKSVDNSKYVCYWIYATNDINRPIYAIPTHATEAFTTMAQARSETPPPLTGLALNPEWKLIYKFIYKGDGEFQESVDYRVTSSLPAGGTAAVAAAGVTFVPYENVTGTNVQLAIQILEDIKAPVNNVLLLDNTTAFTPDADYEPATKKYVDDHVTGGASGTIQTLSYSYPDMTISSGNTVSITGFAATAHTHPAYITGFTETDPIFTAASGNFSTTGHNHTGVYQPLDGDLTAIAATTGNGLLRRNGVEAFIMDTNAYSTTDHNHDLTYLGILAKAADADKLDGYDSLYFSTTGHNHTGVYQPTGSYLTAETDPVFTAASGMFSTTGHNHTGTYAAVSLGSVTGTTYTLVIGDAGNYIRCNNANAIAVTVPLNSSVAFDTGTVISFEQQGAGAVTVSGETTGVTINAYDGKTTYGQYAGMQIVKVDTDVWTCIAGT